MSKLLKKIAKEEEHDLTLATNDFFRPDLKHIGNSIFEIRRHFILEDDRTVTPRNLDNSLANVKDCLLRLAQNHAFVLGLDTRTDKEVDNTNHPKTEPCFMFLSETLSVVLDFTTSPRPGNSVCDVFIIFPTKPSVVLSLVDGDEESRVALAYNTSVARGVRHKLIRFMDEDVNSIHGVINTSTLKDNVAFKTRLKVLADDSSHFVPMRSLLMNPWRYDRVLTAFWVGVAETKSVLRENGEGDNCIRFLTKEQCIILVENINSKDVQVRCMPGSGATTLMLEVARRLSRLGDTLLVCRSREERDRLRSACASVVSVNDLSKLDLSSYVNIVDETNSVTLETRRHHWKFASYLTDIKDLEHRKLIVEKEIDRKEKLMDALINDQWSQSMKYLGYFDVVGLLSGTLRQNIVFQQNKCSSEIKPREPTSKPTHPGPSREGDEKMKDSSQSSESKFWNQQNTARAFQESSDDAKDGWELQHKDNVDAEGHPEKIPETRAENKTGYSSTEKLNDLHTEDRPELQDTDVGEAESRMLQIEYLNEELGSLKSNRDHITRQLDILQTDVNLDIKDDVMGYTEGLYLFKVEEPGLDSVSNYHREDQDESNLQRRMTHRQNTDFTKDSKQKVMTEDEQRLADLTVKNASLEKGPKRHLDAARANTRYCHVTTDGELVNSEPDTRDEGRNRLQKYWGTCSSPIPLPPPTSTLTLLPTTYWETETRVLVRVLRGVPWHVLEMGLVEAGQVDSASCVSLQPRSWCVRVESCDRHGGSLCTRVWRERERGECHQNTVSGTPGTQATLHYGVVLNVGMGRVAFIDLDRGIVLVKYDEVFREPLVPMFSAGFSLSGYTVSMSLISGEDVDMTDTKRALVYQALR